MRLVPDSPLRLALWLVVVILIADGAGLSQEITAAAAIVFTVFSGGLIIRRRKSEGANSSGSRSFLGTSTPLYTYGLLGFGSASVLALLGLMNTGFDVVSRLLEWNWEGFGLSSLEPLIPAAVLAAISLVMILMHVLTTSEDEQ